MREILKYFWQEMKPYKWWYLLFFQTAITAPLYPVLYGYTIKLVIDVIVENNTFVLANFYFPVTLYIFSEVYVNLVWRLSNLGGLYCLPQTINAIWLKSYNYVLNHSYNYFTENLGGSVVSKISGIVDGFNNVREDIHFRFGMALITSLACIIAIGLVSFKLAGFILLLTVIFVFIIWNVVKKMERLSSAESEAKHEVTGLMADVITNIFTVFSFATRGREFKNLTNHLKAEVFPKQRAVLKFEIIFQIISGLFYILLLTIAIFSVVYLRYQGQISVGDVYFILTLTWNFIENCFRATIELEIFLKNIGDLKASFSVIKEANEPDPLENVSLTIDNPEISFENVEFSYGEAVVFNGSNLVIKAGEKVGLVGLSGAGKTTIVNLLLRYISPKQGVVKIDGKNIAEFSKNSVRENIAIIPQDIILFNRTLLENIKYGKPNATLEEVHEACKKANIHEFILSLENGYETMVGERGVKLSGGQRQRVGIARAILKNAKILVLDEATSSLDSESEQFIQNSINNLLDENITVIAIAHRLATLKHMDRIIVLEQGKITEEGKHEALISSENSLYKKLWEGQKL